MPCPRCSDVGCAAITPTNRGTKRRPTAASVAWAAHARNAIRLIIVIRQRRPVATRSIPLWSPLEDRHSAFELIGRPRRFVSRGRSLQSSYLAAPRRPDG
jgi:hypothetical protein